MPLKDPPPTGGSGGGGDHDGENKPSKAKAKQSPPPKKTVSPSSDSAVAEAASAAAASSHRQSANIRSRSFQYGQSARARAAGGAGGGGSTGSWARRKKKEEQDTVVRSFVQYGGRSLDLSSTSAEFLASREELSNVASATSGNIDMETVLSGGGGGSGGGSRRRSGSEGDDGGEGERARRPPSGDDLSNIGGLGIGRTMSTRSAGALVEGRNEPPTVDLDDSTDNLAIDLTHDSYSFRPTGTLADAADPPPPRAAPQARDIDLDSSSDSDPQTSARKASNIAKARNFLMSSSSHDDSDSGGGRPPVAPSFGGAGAVDRARSPPASRMWSHNKPEKTESKKSSGAKAGSSDIPIRMWGESPKTHRSVVQRQQQKAQAQEQRGEGGADGGEEGAAGFLGSIVTTLSTYRDKVTGAREESSKENIAAVGTTPTDRESRVNLAPKRRHSREGLAFWGEAPDADDTYDYAMDYGSRYSTCRDRIRSIVDECARGCGALVGSVLRAVHKHYGPICALLVSAVVAVSVVAPVLHFRSKNATDTSSEGVMRAYADLSDEDRYVVIRSRIVGAGISDSADLPDSIHAASDDDDSAETATGAATNSKDLDEQPRYNTPQFDALRWISADDPRRLDPDHPELMQRYALCVLYHSAGGTSTITAEDESGSDSGRENSTSTVDETSLWIKSYGWMSGQPACAWAGVECHIHSASDSSHFAEDEDLTIRQEKKGQDRSKQFEVTEQVRELNLPSNGLRGTIPNELVHALIHLRGVDLSGNELEGSVPKGIWRLRDLEDINLSRNKLAGHVLPALSALPNLQRVDLSDNALLTGPLIENLGDDSDSLRVLRLANNSFSGSIPSSLGKLWRLSTLTLDSNSIIGTIPDAILAGGTMNLVHFSASNNDISGPLPAKMLALPYLEIFSACGNRLAGTLPGRDVFHSLSDLRTFEVCDNEIRGTIPDSMGSAGRLRTLRLNGNGLTGTVPRSLGDLKELEVAEVHGNGLTGSLPEEMCGGRNTGDGAEGGGDGNETLKVLSADCGKSGKIDCSCCREDECH